MLYYRRQQLLNQNKKEIIGTKIRIVTDYGNSINKEFIPIFFIIAIPTLSFLEGFGIRTVHISYKNLFYFIPVLFGLFMNYKEKIKMSNIYFFMFLFVLSILKITPFFAIDKYFNGNFAMLLFSDVIIVLFYFILSISFYVNDPYYIGYYKSNLQSYKLFYKIISVFFLIIDIILIVLFIKIYFILKYIYI